MEFDITQYTERFNELTARFTTAQEAKDKADAAITEKENRRLQIRTFIEAVEELPADLTEFHSDLWAVLVERVTVQRGGEMIFKLYSGAEITV